MRAASRFDVQFYLVAIFFIIFDLDPFLSPQEKKCIGMHGVNAALHIKGHMTEPNLSMADEPSETIRSEQHCGVLQAGAGAWAWQLEQAAAALSWTHRQAAARAMES